MLSVLKKVPGTVYHPARIKLGKQPRLHAVLLPIIKSRYQHIMWYTSKGTKTRGLYGIHISSIECRAE